LRHAEGKYTGNAASTTRSPPGSAIDRCSLNQRNNKQHMKEKIRWGNGGEETGVPRTAEVGKARGKECGGCKRKDKGNLSLCGDQAWRVRGKAVNIYRKHMPRTSRIRKVRWDTIKNGKREIVSESSEIIVDQWPKRCTGGHFGVPRNISGGGKGP